MPEIDQLEEQRRLMFERLQTLMGFYNRPDGTGLQQQLQQRAGGGQQPFSQPVVTDLLAQNAGASAGRVAGEQDMIRRAFANAGLSGSGLQASAMINSRRRASAATRAGRRNVQSRAALENFQARERAQQQLQSFLAQKQAAEQQASMAEVGLRSQMHETGDAQNISSGQTGAPAPAAAPAPAPAAVGQPGGPPKAPIKWGVTQPQVMAAPGTMSYANQMVQQDQMKMNSQNVYDQQMQNYQARMANWMMR